MPATTWSTSSRRTTVKPAAHDAWSILTQTLADRAWVWIVLGIVTLLGVWFVGESRRAAQARRASAPILESRPTTYTIAAVALLVVALVTPPIARGWLTALALIALVVAGIEVVRAIVNRNHRTPTRGGNVVREAGAKARCSADPGQAVRRNAPTRRQDPDASFPAIEPLQPPAGAPNVLVILLDDVGFAASSAFGGPCATPTAERLAGNGLKYNRFHTTALCAPTRAALLSGRNHHSVGMGVITELATSAPGYNSIRPNTCWRRRCC